jgi:hypothetical protein
VSRLWGIVLDEVIVDQLGQLCVLDDQFVGGDAELV